ncbi:hypothetical protein FRB95_007725 [Tulasnella sp. JGI-2019a]|nr:hypothetical protein FRB95_007725 [Tulasnella sp. JGI-2019a]
MVGLSRCLPWCSINQMLESRTGWCGPVWSGRTLTPATAAALWKQYIQPLKITHPNLKLTSPAVTNGGAPSGIAWLYSLFCALGAHLMVLDGGSNLILRPQLLPHLVLQSPFLP